MDGTSFECWSDGEDRGTVIGGSTCIESGVLWEVHRSGLFCCFTWVVVCVQNNYMQRDGSLTDGSVVV